METQLRRERIPPSRDQLQATTAQQSAGSSEN
jgi:hypothetical protein